MIDSQTIVVSDIKQCLNCGNCISACKRRHKDVSRHVRDRSAILGISLIPNLCKICRNPKCIETCNRHGVERDEEGHIVVTENCVGCGLCMRACPYSAILLFSKQEPEISFLNRIITFIAPRKSKIPEEDKKTDQNVKKKRRRVAVKCDSCAGYNNRACVYNCPTGALKIMTIKDFILKNKGSISVELRELLKYSLEGAEGKGKNGRG